MAPKKNKKKPKKTYAKKQPLDPNVEEIYEEEVWFNCPKRGMIKQKVKIKRYKTKCIDNKEIIGSEVESGILDQIERTDDGLSIYTEEDLSKED